MASSLSTAKMRSVSWNALETVEPFTEAVKRQLEILKSTQRTKVFPRTALSDDQLDKVILWIGCLCYSGMQWRTAMAYSRTSVRCAVRNRVFLLCAVGALGLVDQSPDGSVPPLADGVIRIRRSFLWTVGPAAPLRRVASEGSMVARKSKVLR